jgi:ATP-dependent DNA helicase RecG
MLETQSNDKIVPSLLETLYERLGEQENLELEFKASQNALPKNIWETVSAFANTKGGWIILGIDENENNVEINGVSDASALLDTFYSLLRNPQKISFSVCGANDAKVEDLGDKQIVILRIPAASRKNRPVHVGNNPYGGTYLRRNSGDYKCNKQEVDQMMREASADSATSTILHKYDLDDLDTDTLNRYRRRYQTSQPASTFNSYNDKEFLRAIGAYRRNRDSGQEGLTVAGLLMFGKEVSLREWRARHLIDYRLISHENELEDRRWDDRTAWQGNLLGAYELIYPKLIKSQPIPFRLEQGVRVDDPPSHVALREALVNLLVHADYAEPDASLIIQSPESYHFRNPGSSRVLETDLLKGNRSDPRNPELVSMFRFIGVCDEGGTGIPKIIRAWRTLGFKNPTIDIGTERYEFSIKLRHVHLISEEDQIWLGTLGANWNEAEQLALVMAKHDGDVDNFRLRQLTNQHPADVTKVLRNLKSRNLLKMIGSGHKAKYELGNSAIDNLFFSLTPRSDIDSSYTTKDDSYTTKSDNHTTKGESYATKISYVLIDAEEVWNELESSALTLKGRQRAKPEERELSILQLLEIAPLSMQELRKLTGLSKAYLHQRLQSLIQKSEVVFLHPQQPSHPSQKYCVPDKLREV